MSKKSASQEGLASARYEANMTHNTIMNDRQSIDKTREQMMKQNQDFNKALEEQQASKLDTIRYDEIIKLLMKGLTQFDIVKTHWTKLVTFFQQSHPFF